MAFSLKTNILKPERILRYIDKDCDEEESDRNAQEPRMRTLLEILTPIIFLWFNATVNSACRSFIAAKPCQLCGAVYITNCKAQAKGQARIG